MQNEILDINRLLLIKKVYAKYIKSKTEDEALACSYAIFAEILYTKDFNSQQELTEALGCNKAHTSRTILKMQNEGLVQTNSKTISLTDKGRQYAENVIEHKKSLIRSLFEGVTEDEKKSFIKVLNKIVENSKIFGEKE